MEAFSLMKRELGLIRTDASGSQFHIEHIRPALDGGKPVKREIKWSNVLESRSGFGDNIWLLPEDRLMLTPLTPPK
jgi:hypothetical protein